MNNLNFNLFFTLIKQIFTKDTLLIKIHTHFNFFKSQRDVAMKNIITELNDITKSIYRIFPTLLILPPLIANSAVIDQSTTNAQTFSQDQSYTINEGVEISTTNSGPAVTVSGDETSDIENFGTIAANGDGISIESMKQGSNLDNKAGAHITSSNGNGITVNVMGGSINNSGTITGKIMAF